MDSQGRRKRLGEGQLIWTMERNWTRRRVAIRPNERYLSQIICSWCVFIDELPQGIHTYVAIPVVEGRCDTYSIRPSFIRYPELSGEALRLYIDAYGEETYRYYIEEFYKGPSELVDDSVPFRQLPVHDAESIIWIIIDNLIKAIPEGGDPEVTKAASAALRLLADHPVVLFYDFRRSFIKFPDWAQDLHPKLSHLAPMLRKLTKLLIINWTLLCIKGLLPQDILHEAVKRVFLQEIDRIRTEKCDVRLELEIRRPLVSAPKIREASPSTKRKSTSVVESTPKRTRYDWRVTPFCSSSTLYLRMVQSIRIQWSDHVSITVTWARVC